MPPPALKPRCCAWLMTPLNVRPDCLFHSCTKCPWLPNSIARSQPIMPIQTSTFACGQNCGAKPITCVIPTGMSTAEKTRLKASNAVSSRTRPVAFLTKRPCLPTCASAAVVATFPPLFVRGGENTPTRRLWDGGFADDELDGQNAPFGAGRVPFDQVDGQLCCLLSEPHQRLPDRGERWYDKG